MKDKPKIFSDLEKIAPLIPAPVSWGDLNYVVTGANELLLQVIGANDRELVIGKTLYELYPKRIADPMMRKIKQVVREKRLIEAEETIVDIKTGKVRWFLATRAPLFDDDGINVVGVIGTALEITEHKENERLRAETELQKTKFDEQEQFRKVADQVVHDIRSPLASLLMIVKSCEKDIPETVRVALREAAISIGDIANQLLSKYEKEDIKLGNDGGRQEGLQPVMVVLSLLQLLSEKKHQYKELPVNFTHDFYPKCNFAFIQAEPLAFKRMMSNIVNNAVDAIEEGVGVVGLQLSMDDKNIKIIIQDNGKGMSQGVIDNIMNNMAVTSNKKEGHGIGFVQIRETLERNHGRFTIESKVGKGTKITLTFPLIATPNWIAKDIKLNKGDTLVILDDDSSIHSAWEARFKEYNEEIILKHFTSGEETIKFINNFPQKEKIFLLTDFELLKQELNGLHVIERTGIERAILVTSHYTNLVIRNLVIKSGAKILPKLLAPEISVEIKNGIVDKSDKPVMGGCGKIDVVLVDDDKMFADSLALFFEANNKVVNKYYDIDRFLENISRYAKDTKIFIDNHFRGHVEGIGLAKKLHGMGYTKLYLLSGKKIGADEVPDYLTLALKTDLDGILHCLLNE